MFVADWVDTEVLRKLVKVNQRRLSARPDLLRPPGRI